MEFLAVLAVFWSLFLSIFWLVIGFRAMRAHEALAERIRLLGKAVEKVGAPQSPE